MNEENYTVINLEDIIKADKKAAKREKFNRKFNDALKWVTENKELVFMVVPAVTGAVAGVTGLVRKTVTQKRTKDLKELYCYDPSLGHYWRLRRKLTNSDWCKIDQRKRNGERLGDILNDLKVLK